MEVFSSIGTCIVLNINFKFSLCVWGNQSLLLGIGIEFPNVPQDFMLDICSDDLHLPPWLTIVISLLLVYQLLSMRSAWHLQIQRNKSCGMNLQGTQKNIVCQNWKHQTVEKGIFFCFDDFETVKLYHVKSRMALHYNKEKGRMEVEMKKTWTQVLQFLLERSSIVMMST